MMGAGGDGGPLGIFLALKRGGSRGSSATSTILMILWPVPLPPLTPPAPGV